MCTFYPWKPPIWIAWFKLKRRSPKWSTQIRLHIAQRSNARSIPNKCNTALLDIWRPSEFLMDSSFFTLAGWNSLMRQLDPNLQVWTSLKLRRRILNSSRILHISTFLTTKSTCTTWWIWSHYKSLTCNITRWTLCSWFQNVSRICILSTFLTIEYHLVTWQLLDI